MNSWNMWSSKTKYPERILHYTASIKDYTYSQFCFPLKNMMLIYNGCLLFERILEKITVLMDMLVD